VVQEAVAQPRHYRCVGIGVGPANLSLASLMHGHAEITNLFLDKKESFGWHDGQQIPGATIQVSMLKDLVSLCEPTNSFSFLAYLSELGRIYHFINAQFESVPREEFRNYMEWACRKNENIIFGQEVLSVDFAGTFVITTPSMTVTADNIAVGVGVQPAVPAPAIPHLGDRQFHVCDFMSKAVGLGGLRVGVIGGGQSGAEAFLDLIGRPGDDLPRRVVWISRRPNYLPIDDSPFTNDYYTPSYSDYFASLDPATRQGLNARHILTSDGISEATLRSIYQRMYIRRFLDGYADLVALYPNRSVTEITSAPARAWNLALAHNEHDAVRENVELDVVIWATGYRPAPLTFLSPISSRLERDGEEFKIDDNFAAIWDGPAGNNIFFQNAARGQRGLADPNLSLNAWRSQRILDRLRGVRTEQQHDSFIEWVTKPASGDLRPPMPGGRR
jgi:lysine N6-hydroxylase